jgi:hypothetical protein
MIKNPLTSPFYCFPLSHHFFRKCLVLWSKQYNFFLSLSKKVVPNSTGTWTIYIYITNYSKKRAGKKYNSKCNWVKVEGGEKVSENLFLGGVVRILRRCWYRSERKYVSKGRYNNLIERWHLAFRFNLEMSCSYTSEVVHSLVTVVKRVFRLNYVVFPHVVSNQLSACVVCNIFPAKKNRNMSKKKLVSFKWSVAVTAYTEICLKEKFEHLNGKFNLLTK